ncbi:membrane protein insertase YidC [Candidatus Avelusimicrobium luingense]|uniref:membrane protein insertase YidC n=1 Tax=Candidatus Avelusimicrobium luingense TaxID=3416211 RepID=UPI003D0C1484
MNRQFLTTLMIFLLFLTGYNQFVVVPRAKAAQQAAEEQLRKQEQEKQTAATLVRAGETALVSKESATAPKPEELITLNLPQADVTFSSKGAGIKTYLFKDILGDVDLTPYDGEGYFSTLPEIDFVEYSRTQNSITFTGDIIAGFSVQKTYTFNENGINQLTVSFHNSTGRDLTLSPWKWNFGPGLATVKSEMNDNERESKAVYLVQEEDKRKPTLETFTPKSKQPSLPWMWAGLENRYFLAVLIPQEWTPGELSAQKVTVGKQKRFFGLSEGELDGPALQIAVPGVTVAAKSTVSYKSDFYFGPKDYKAFLKLPYHFERSIAFGFFGSLGKLARNVLEWLYGWTGNYGVAIILMTILIQLLLLRFTVMQLKSAAQMKKIQPEMKRIQEKYKGNPEALNRETLNLYRKHKVNPLSGCLPLLIQLPIFLALFNALRTSWALHGAKFVLWITDLSSKDPYYILPLLMGAVMFFQQRHSMPAGTDPAQAAMFKYMPLIFTLLFMNFPSGLVLYWLTNSLLTFAIQVTLNRRIAKTN